MARTTRRQLTNLLGALGLVAVLAALVVGLPAIDRWLPSDRAVSADEPYPVGGGVTVVPPPGSTVDVSATRPGDDAGTVLFHLGPVRYAIVVRPFAGDLEAAAARLRQRITSTAGYQVTGDQLAVHTVAGLTGLQGGYTAPGQGGRYAVFVTAGLTIEVTISGGALDLGRTLPGIERSTRTLRHDGTLR